MNDILGTFLEAPKNVDEVDRLCRANGWSRQKFCNALSEHIARQYVSGSVNFEVADTAINWLWAFAFHEMGAPIPELFLNIYLAFDGGENPSKAGISAETLYTLPKLKAILMQLDSRLQA